MLQEKKNMIFHIPLQFDFNAKSASGIRPIKMLNAFKELGYEVIEISGYSSERKRKIKNAKKEIKNGKKINFVYSESSTMPTLLTDPHHLPLHPFVDFAFFKFCNKKNIPIGLFYRDIHWKFPELYDRQIGGTKAFFAKIFYRYDLFCYAKLLKKIYLPSNGMTKYLGEFPNITDELPPGCDSFDLKEVSDAEIQNRQIMNLLYIGGIGSMYQLHLIFKAVAHNCRFSLTLCTRDNEWDEHRLEYIENDIIPQNINVVHFSGEKIKELYEKTDITVYFIQPHSYEVFGVPFKLFEYIGYNKPVLASAGTYVGNFVSKNDIGWTIPYDIDSLNEFLKNITYEEVLQKKENAVKLAVKSRWIDRAAKVAADMKGS